jgi:hypothetical protein
VSNDFRLEPEITIKLAKREARLFEVPISYSGRTYAEEKKIGSRFARYFDSDSATTSTWPTNTAARFSLVLRARHDSTAGWLM